MEAKVLSDSIKDKEYMPLTHCDRVTHLCVTKLTVIGPDNGLSPGRRHAIIWTNAWILLIGPLGTNFNEVFIIIHTFSFKKIQLKMSSGKWRPFCLGLNVLNKFIWNVINHPCPKFNDGWAKPPLMLGQNNYTNLCESNYISLPSVMALLIVNDKAPD